MKKFNFAASVSLFLAIILSCTTMSDYDFRAVDSAFSSGNYETAKTELEKRSKSLYSKHDSLLAALDCGALAHYTGDYQKSNEYFSKAEVLIDKYKSSSVSQAVASLMSNDLSVDYPGEDFEDIYTNIFMALNYLKLNDFEGAMVEIRRFDNKLKVLKSKYETEVAQINSLKTKESDIKIEKASTQFSNSALARYLSLLLYRAEGDFSNAEVDLKFLKSAFETQPSLYNFSIPSTVNEELQENYAKSSKARLNILGLYGKAPVKTETSTRLFHKYYDFWYKVVTPTLEKRSTNVERITVTVRSKTNGTVLSKQLEKIESIENIAEDTFKQRLSFITSRAITQAVTKTLTSSTVTALSESSAREGYEGSSLLFGLAGLALRIHNETTERADTRCSRYFPANAAVTGLSLNPGDYTVTINYQGGGKTLYSEQQEITVKCGGLNFIETKYIK